MVNRPAHLAPRRWLVKVPMLAGVLVAAGGIIAVAAWAADFAPMQSLSPGVATIKANAALCLILCGTSLALLTGTGPRLAGLASVAKVAAGLALAIAALTVAEYWLHTSFGIDTMLFSAAAHADRSELPGRMAIATALSFVFAGTALLTLRSQLAGWLAVAVAVHSFVVIVGYAYSLESRHKLFSFTAVSLSAAAGLFALSLGILCADSRVPLALTVKSPGGRVLRQLIPAAVIIPTLVGWIVQEGERRGWYTDPIGVGVMAAVTIMAFAVAIGIAARSLDTSETRRTEVEHDLNVSEFGYRDLFDSAPVGLSHSLPDGTLMEVNQAFVRLMGYADAAALRVGWATDLFVNPVEREKLRSEVNELGHVAAEVELRRADGKAIWVELHSRVIERDNEPPQNETAFIDITQRKTLEQQFMQAQKMEAVGRLAGGIAHDFNNLLTVIRSYCDLVLLEMPPAAPACDDLRQISGAADRAAALARQLLAFSRKQVLLPQVLNLNAIVMEVHSMLRRVLPSGVNSEMIAARDLWLTRVDPGQLDQVLMNLAINASDAMPKGGRLLIETSNCTIDAGYARLHSGVEPGEFVCVAVSDTGTGMDAETQSHMFEPFYTTKPVGKGTGLGLATVYGIVEQHKGHMFVHSELGEGTTFKMYFPRMHDSAGATAPRVSKETVRHTGPAPVVLVVEDDDAVRRTIAKVLGLEGYTVLEAAHGGEGMRVATTHKSAINLVISDVRMPEMGGREFVERLGKVHPESRVLLISGYTDDDVLRRGEIDPAYAFLEKPFTVDQLVRKVQGVLS